MNVSNNNTTPDVQSGSFFTKIIGTVGVIVLILAIAVVSYRYMQQEKATKLLEQTPARGSYGVFKNKDLSAYDRAALAAVVWDGSKQASTTLSFDDYLLLLDTKIADSALSSDVRTVMLFRKALALMGSTSKEQANFSSFTDNLVAIDTILDGLYTSSSPYARTFQDLATLGYVKQYVDYGFYAPLTSIGLPKDLSDAYTSFAATQKDATEKQKKSMSIYMELAYDPSLQAITKDKMYLAYRMYLAANYLHSFYDTLSPTERDAVRKRLQNDVELFPRSSYIYVQGKEAVVGFFYAYAFDVMSSVGVEALSQDGNKRINDLYVAAKSKATLDFVNKAENSALKGIIDSYYLSSVSRRYAQQERAPHIATLLDMIRADMTETPRAEKSLRYLYADIGSPLSWRGTKVDLHALAMSHSEFKKFAESLGVVFK